jgi:hypothetical protein
MAVSVKPITLWRRELQDRPGALADSLAPLADDAIDLKVLMAYRFPGEPGRAAVELFPIAGSRATAAAERGGFGASNIPALLVEGDNSPGLGWRLSRAVADAGINMDFVVAQVVGSRYLAVFGFADEAGARGAVPVIKKAGAAPKRTAAKAKRGRTRR